MPPVDRLLLTTEAEDFLAVARSIVAKDLRPRVDEAERDGEFPRDVFRTLGHAGLLGLPYPEELGGGGQPYEIYLQILEEVAGGWASVGVGTSVHALSCFPLYTAGTDVQKKEWLPEMLGGDQLGAYCLSEAHAGSDPAAMRTRAVRDGDEYVINGAKAWTTHGGEADFYTVMARTSDDGARGISCFLVPADTPGLTADYPESKMGLTGSTTATMVFEDVRVSAHRRIGEEGEGLSIALAGLDNGRLGIAAVATGVAQAALDVAVRYAQERETFGKPIIDHQGLAFLLADMDAAVQSARADVPRRGPAPRRRAPVRPRGRDRQARRHRQRREGHLRRRAGARRRRLHQGLPGRALHARDQGDADLRGHQPDPAADHREGTGPRCVVGRGAATVRR